MFFKILLSDKDIKFYNSRSLTFFSFGLAIWSVFLTKISSTVVSFKKFVICHCIAYLFIFHSNNYNIILSSSNLSTLLGVTRCFFSHRLTVCSIFKKSKTIHIIIASPTSSNFTPNSLIPLSRQQSLDYAF